MFVIVCLCNGKNVSIMLCSDISTNLLTQIQLSSQQIIFIFDYLLVFIFSGYFSCVIFFFPISPALICTHFNLFPPKFEFIGKAKLIRL